MAKQKKQELTPELLARAKAHAKADVRKSKAINQLATWIRAFVRRITRVSSSQTRDTPSDISQEVTIKVIECLASFEAQSVEEFQNWVEAIALNKTRQSIRYARRKKRSIESELLVEDPSKSENLNPQSPSQIFGDHEVAVIAMRVLFLPENFKPETRGILVQRIFAKVPVAEIAKRYGTTVAQVDSAFRRNIVKLQRLVWADMDSATPRKPTTLEENRRAKLGLAYLRACESGTDPDPDAFLADAGVDDDETRQMLEMFRELRNLPFGPDDEE